MKYIIFALSFTMAGSSFCSANSPALRMIVLCSHLHSSAQNPDLAVLDVPSTSSRKKPGRLHLASSQPVSRVSRTIPPTYPFVVSPTELSPGERVRLSKSVTEFMKNIQRAENIQRPPFVLDQTHQFLIESDPTVSAWVYGASLFPIADPAFQKFFHSQQHDHQQRTQTEFWIKSKIKIAFDEHVTLVVELATKLRENRFTTEDILNLNLNEPGNIYYLRDAFAIVSASLISAATETLNRMIDSENSRHGNSNGDVSSPKNSLLPVDDNGPEMKLMDQYMHILEILAQRSPQAWDIFQKDPLIKRLSQQLESLFNI